MFVYWLGETVEIFLDLVDQQLCRHSGSDRCTLVYGLSIDYRTSLVWL